MAYIGCIDDVRYTNSYNTAFPLQKKDKYLRQHRCY